MKFGHHLLSHLTPEWRKQYVNYEALKSMLYDMIGNESTTHMDEVTGLTIYTVDTEIQDKFFTEINKELQKVEGFFRAQEAEAKFKFRELKLRATAYQEELLHHRFSHILRLQGGNVEVLKLAFGEFYLNLILLQNFQKLNYTAFRKILKKHDKLATTFKGLQFFNENVHDNYFYTSEEVEKLITEVENTFAICLEGGDKSKAMKKLRVPPLGGKRSHWVTLRTGLFNGMILVSIVVIVIAIDHTNKNDVTCGMIQQQWCDGTCMALLTRCDLHGSKLEVFTVTLHPSNTWPENWMPLFRALRAGLLVVLALYGFATNTYVWRTTGVNSTLIFEFDSRDYCSFTQLYEIASLMGVIWIICVYLFVFADRLGIPPEVGPSVMLLVVPAILFLPLPVFYWRSRLWLIRILARVSLAPFFYVNFADFWLADQLNSLAVVLLDVESFGCWVAWGNHNPDSNPECGQVIYGIRPVLAALPAWFRFAQCLRRYYNTKKAFPHLVNAGKYSTSFFVVAFSSLASSLHDDDADSQSTGYYVAFSLWIISAFISTCYTFTWDIKMDWGLFDDKYYLREQLIYSKKLYYILAIFEDLVFRCLWTLNISVGETDVLPHREILTTVLAILEVFRRFVWNFFRLEAEHLNNVGEFRAVRDISLHPIKLQPKDEGEEDVLHPLPSLPQGSVGSMQVAHISSHNNSHNASIKSLNVNHSPNSRTPVVTSCNIVIENHPNEVLAAVANKLSADEHTARTAVKNSTETLTEAPDEIELVTANHSMEADPQVTEMLTDTAV